MLKVQLNSPVIPNDKLNHIVFSELWHIYIYLLYIYIYTHYYTLHILVNVDHLATNHTPFSGSSQDHPGKRPGPRLGVECHESLWCAGGSSSLRSSVILGLRIVSPSQSPDSKPCHGLSWCILDHVTYVFLCQLVIQFCRH